MSSPPSLQRLNLKQFAERFRAEMIPLGNRFCYFCAAVSLTPDDLREYLDEPVAALPPVVAARLPRIRILLVPYLEMAAEAGRARRQPDLLVATEKPSEAASSRAASIVNEQDAVLAFAIKDTEVADYHYRFYRAIAELIAGADESPPAGYAQLLQAELKSHAHGEVDKPAWRLKQELRDSDFDAAKLSQRFQRYARQSFIDSLTLYLHGICCDIDVETGPRQLASNLARNRLRLLKRLYPPPEGYAVLPEDLKPGEL